MAAIPDAVPAIIDTKVSLLKYGKCVTATAIFACLAVFLYACGEGADSGSITESFVSTPWSQAEVFTIPSEPQTSRMADDQTDTDAVLRRIEAARAVFGMFSETRPQLDKSDSIEVEEGLSAYRVTDPALDTMEKLQAYVSGFFSEEITQRLLNIGIFIESDDRLYALDVGMQPAETGELHVEVTEKTETSEHYRLTVGTDAARQTHDFVYEKQADGNWVFTRFEIF